MSALLRGLLRRGGYMAPEGGGEGGGGGGGVGAPTPPEPQSFSVDYVRELRAENKGYRLKHQEAETKLAKALADLETATKGAEEMVKKATTETQTAADQRVIRAELKAAAVKAGMVDLDGLKLADLSKVKLNPETGEVEGADALMEEMKKGKPYLFGSTNTGSTEKPPKPGDPASKKATEMTPQEYADARKAAISGGARR